MQFLGLIPTLVFARKGWRVKDQWGGLELKHIGNEPFEIGTHQDRLAPDLF